MAHLSIFFLSRRVRFRRVALVATVPDSPMTLAGNDCEYKWGVMGEACVGVSMGVGVDVTVSVGFFNSYDDIKGRAYFLGGGVCFFGCAGGGDVFHDVGHVLWISVFFCGFAEDRGLRWHDDWDTTCWWKRDWQDH